MKNIVSHAEEIVAAIGAELDGIVPVQEAEARGVSHEERRALRERGVLLTVCRGANRLRDHPLTWRTRCRASLVAVGPDSALARRSAARLHGLYAYRSSDAVEVVAIRGRDTTAPPFGRLVETRWLPDDHLTVVDGLPVTTIARTFFDLCGDPDGGLSVAHPAHERAMIRVYNDALARRGLSFTQEAAVLLTMARRGRAGTRLVRKILTRFGHTYTPTRSDTETLFYELVAAYGLPEPEKQVVLADGEGFIGVVDFLWRPAHLVVEVDSSWHDGPLDREVDEERDRRLVAAGYAVRRYRYGDLVTRPAAIARELAAVVGLIGPTTAGN
jgi:predicted transcriptional regulator of viral defense system